MKLAAQTPVDAPGGFDANPAPRREPFRRYLAALGGGILGMLALFYLLLLALHANGSLAPPAFVNSLCLDEKLRFMRENRPNSPDLLVVGSSVAWRHVDSAALAPAAGYTRALNAGMCGLHVNQSVFVADWLLDRLPSVKHVVMLASPVDFSACRTHPTAVFDRRGVDRYVFEGASPWPYYMTYFSPRSVFRGARDLKARKANVMELDALVFTPSGDGPLDTLASRDGLYYGPPDPLDPACFSALGSLARRLQRSGKLLTVVTTPLHHRWREAYDPDDRFLLALDARIAQALGPGSHRLWNAGREWAPASDSAFTDAIHLRWSAVPSFTQALAERIRNQAAAGAH